MNADAEELLRRFTHDLKSPMNVLMMFLERLDKGGCPPDLTAFLATDRTSMRKLQQLVVSFEEEVGSLR